MTIFIQNINNSKLYFADLFLKTSSLERQLRVPKSVFHNLKLKKPLLEGLFQRRDSSISMNGTPLGQELCVPLVELYSSTSMNGTPLGPVGFGTNGSTILASR